MLDFIVDSWVKSYKYAIECRYQDINFYKATYTKTVLAIIKRSKIELVNEDEYIKSFVVYEEFDNYVIIHYMYTRRSSRKKGHGFSLFKKLKDKNKIIYFTFITLSFIKMLEKHGIDLEKDKITYNPFLRVMGEKDE